MTRSFFSGRLSCQGLPGSREDPKEATVTFVLRDGSKRVLNVARGSTILEIAHANDIDLEGACEGSIACSTCHVYLDQETYDKLEEAGDDENDMLDLAFGLSEVSRLGCQVVVDENTDGMTVTLPPATRNMAVDGHIAKHH